MKVTKEEQIKRRNRILRLVVKEHIVSGNPVASGYLINKYRLQCSSATIRNDFVFLEKEGYLSQPHVSSGRVPTGKAYRYFVDNLKIIPPVSKKEEKEVNLFFRSSERGVEEVVKKTAIILNRLTDCFSMVYAPFFGISRFKHLDLVFLSHNSLLLVLITDTGKVIKRVVELGSRARPIEIDMIEKKLNALFSRTSLSNIKEIIQKDGRELGEDDPERDQTVKCILDELLSIIAEEEKKNLFLEGSLELIDDYYQEDKEDHISLLNNIDSHFQVFKLFSEARFEKMPIVRIERENDSFIQGHCLIISSYGAGDFLEGKLGVIGPLRVNYPRIMSVVGFIANMLGNEIACYYE